MQKNTLLFLSTAISVGLGVSSYLVFTVLLVGESPQEHDEEKTDTQSIDTSVQESVKKSRHSHAS